MVRTWPVGFPPMSSQVNSHFLRYALKGRGTGLASLASAFRSRSSTNVRRIGGRAADARVLGVVSSRNRVLTPSAPRPERKRSILWRRMHKVGGFDDRRE